MNLVCSVEQLDGWRARHPEERGEALTLPEAAAFGLLWRAPLGLERDEHEPV
jgi:hypothetical protein